jgi:hypothetical protein
MLGVCFCCLSSLSDGLLCIAFGVSTVFLFVSYTLIKMPLLHSEDDGMPPPLGGG